MEKRILDSKAIASASKHFEKFYYSEVFTDIINNFSTGMLSYQLRLLSNNNKLHCNENPIYVFLFWELIGLSPNFHILVYVSDVCVILFYSVIIYQKIFHRQMSVGTGRQNIIILFWK
jgi:hypothetical protein